MQLQLSDRWKKLEYWDFFSFLMLPVLFSLSTSYIPVLILFPSAILRLISLVSLLGVNTLAGGIGVVLELLWILNEQTYQVLDSPVYC